MAQFSDYFRGLDARVRANLRSELVTRGEAGATYFRVVVLNWSNKPQFKTRVEFNDTQYKLYIQPEGQHRMLFIWTDEGTKPHIIRPKGPGYPLRFRSGHNPKTVPVARANVGDGRSTGPWVSKYEVNHPGTEAREFRPEMQRRLEIGLQSALEQAIEKAL